MRGARTEDPVVISTDEDEHLRVKKKKHRKICRTVCDCPRTYTVGYNPKSEAKWTYAKRFKMSRCSWGRLRLYIRSVKSAIGHYVCEMNKTFITPGQRMYFSAPFTKKNLMDFLSTPVERMRIKLSSGRSVYFVRLMRGVDYRATITSNWKRFLKKAKLAVGDICGFFLRIRKGKPTFIVHKI